MAKLGLGPMSSEIAKMICDHAVKRSRPLMLIASRNQSDCDEHYSCSPDHLASLVASTNGMVTLCRDHCGPFFKDNERHTSLDRAMEACLRTIDNDARLGFAVVHIDPSRIPDQAPMHARKLIERCLEVNPGVMLEYGSEGIDDVASTTESLIKDLEFIKPYQERVRYIVVKTGSLVRDGQTGRFDARRVRELSGIIDAHGYHLKEHNADYLQETDVSLRWMHGVSAMNIAPQLGVAQTRVMLHLCQTHGQMNLWEQLRELTLAGSEWRKWSSSSNPDHAAIFSAHYYRNTDVSQRIVDLDPDAYDSLLRHIIDQIIDTYHTP